MDNIITWITNLILANKHVHNKKSSNRYPHISLNITFSKKERGLKDTVTTHQGDTELA